MAVYAEGSIGSEDTWIRDEGGMRPVTADGAWLGSRNGSKQSSRCVQRGERRACLMPAKPYAPHIGSVASTYTSMRIAGAVKESLSIWFVRNWTVSFR